MAAGCLCMAAGCSISYESGAGSKTVAAPSGGSTAGQYSIVIHGGAGTLSKDGFDGSYEPEFRAKLQEALEAGEAVLKADGSSLDAVVAAIKVLEDCPLFNAGKGAVLNAAGNAELDSSIMEGSSKRAGAVAGVHRIKNPITAARAVMEKTPHVLLVADGADAFAAEVGLDMVSPEYFVTEKNRKDWEKWKEKQALKKAADAAGEGERLGRKHGTVGAVARDRRGNLAAGTSTGGMQFKRPGRVGDSPIIGAGTYADNRNCAISATGHGEYFIRHAVTHDITSLMAYRDYSLEQAAHEVIHNTLVKAGGEGGIIAIDRAGNIVTKFNSAGMFRAGRREGEKGFVIVEK